MSERRVSVDFKDFKEFAKFLDAWGSEMTKAQYINIFENPKIVEAIAGYVGDEIEDAVGHDSFGRFMAERTYVQVVPTNKGITLHVGGYTEKEMMEMGRNSRYNEETKKDYNLWEMYEFHGGSIGTQGIPVGVGKKQTIKKDVAGPLAIRTKTGGTQELKGRRGLINSVMNQIRSGLAAKLGEIVQDLGGLTVAYAAAEAAGKAKALEGLHGVMRTKVRALAKKLDVDLAKIGFNEQSISVSSSGIVAVRSGGGQVVSSPLTGKRISITK